MFENGSSGKRSALLMVASDEDDDGDEHANVVPLDRTDDRVSQHRRARAARQKSKPNPLLKALGKKSPDYDQSVEDEALAAIERDVDELIDSTRPSLNAERGPQDQPREYQTYYQNPRDDSFKPLIDPVIILDAIWRWRMPIVGLTILGGVVGAFSAVSTPRFYTAYSQVQIDPREVKLIGQDLTPEFLGNESALAIVDGELESVLSTPVLSEVVEKLNLDQDPEFNGTGDDGIGLLDGIAFVRSLFSNETPVDTAERVTLENLRNGVSAERTARTFVFSISAQSQSPRRAAEIANAVTDSFISNQGAKKSTAARNASSALAGQIESLKAAVETAERRAAEFAQANNLTTKVEGLTLSDAQLVATSAQLTEAKSATIRAKSLADAAQSVSVDQVVSGGIPPELVTVALTTFRAQFASLSQNAASLEQALGPRHPRLAQAIATRDAARDEIAAELKRISAGAQASLRRSIQNEQEIAASLASAKVDAGESGEALIKLRELESEIEAARSIYRSALLRSRETNQLENLATVNATLISEAEPPLHPSSLSRKFIAGSGLFAGLLAGLGLAFLAGLRDCIASNRDAPSPRPTPSTDRMNQSRRPVRSSGGKRVTNPTNQTTSPATASSESNMYPGAPFYPYAPAPEQQQPTMSQPPYQQGFAPQQMQAQYAPPHAPVPQPMHPYPHAPQQHYAPYPPAPMGYAPQPVPQPVYVQAPVPMPHQQWQQPAPQMQAQPTPPPQQSVQYSDEVEMEELRASVQEIRDVVDHLAQRRGTRRQYG